MYTNHTAINVNANLMKTISDNSIQLIVTSPPYPMIEMWDSCFAEQDASIETLVHNKQYEVAFEHMHIMLDDIWKECDRVLMPNGFICINVGDATRTFDGIFRLFSNHTRIMQFFQSHGYFALPDVIWRKQSNSPNKFMGSGMLPAGAYVTYEHEYILIFRKGGKREFNTQSEKDNRRSSAYFWEERNTWFSDLWEIKGTKQKMILNKSRGRSAAFPFEIPYRLINMYSVKGDTVLDPFVGTGTTMLACMASERNSIGVDIDGALVASIPQMLLDSVEFANSFVQKRVENHLQFVNSLSDDKLGKCYQCLAHNFKVKTRQEVGIQLNRIVETKRFEESIKCTYE